MHLSLRTLNETSCLVTASSLHRVYEDLLSSFLLEMVKKPLSPLYLYDAHLELRASGFHVVFRRHEDLDGRSQGTAPGLLPRYALRRHAPELHLRLPIIYS